MRGETVPCDLGVEWEGAGEVGMGMGMGGLEVGCGSQLHLKRKDLSLPRVVGQAKLHFLHGMLHRHADPEGLPMQRTLFYFMRALQARAEGTGSQRYNEPYRGPREVGVGV